MYKNRILYLDIIRILACGMIVLMHSPMPHLGTSSYILSTVSYLTAPGIGLFFMVSGALLLPVNISSKDFMKHRLSKVLWPTIFWTFVYLILQLYIGNITLNSLPKRILSIPFSVQGHSILWFLYALIGLYILAPIISPWLKQTSKKNVELILIIWGITLIFPFLNEFLTISHSETGTFYYFSGYAGYFLLGYYLRTYINKINIISIIALIALPIFIAIYCKLANVDVDFYQMFWYLSILVASMSAGWFMMAKKYLDNKKALALTTTLSNCSFGVYLAHIFIMRNFLWHLDFISAFGGLIQIILTTILSLIISYSLVYLISKLPFSKYIIGY